jgi:hypothetical protein
MDFAEYCREIEAYLCRKNNGHLIRIVGPTFEKVRGWAAMGVPFKVACRGIDRCCERRRANGPRRRPVRLEFCEADVLDEFDRWRRAVGLLAGPGERAVPDRAEVSGTSRASLPQHLDRVASRLTALGAGRSLTPAFAARIDLALDEIETMRQRAHGLRAAARAAVVARLAVLDREILGAARDELADERDALADEAAAELAPFRMRMTAQAWVSAVDSVIDRLVRERLGLPTIEMT